MASLSDIRKIELRLRSLQSDRFRLWVDGVRKSSLVRKDGRLSLERGVEG